MGRKVGCPLEKWPDAWILLPDEWLGEHIERRDRAVAAARDEGLGVTLTQLTVVMALLDDWGDIPGLGGNPKNWDFTKLRAEVIAWLNERVLQDFGKCFEVPKDLSSPSGKQQTETEGT